MEQAGGITAVLTGRKGGVEAATGDRQPDPEVGGWMEEE